MAQIEGDFEKGIDQGSHDALTVIVRAALLHGQQQQDHHQQHDHRPQAGGCVI